MNHLHHFVDLRYLLCNYYYYFQSTQQTMKILTDLGCVALHSHHFPNLCNLFYTLDIKEKYQEATDLCMFYKQTRISTCINKEKWLIGYLRVITMLTRKKS